MSRLFPYSNMRYLALALALSMPVAAHAGDLRLKLPKRTKPTPVQKLNQDGVKAVQKHDYEKAKRLFYKAYLLDPNDPFTLNNLGYIAELEGEIDRAQRFYALAAEQPSDALIDKASDDQLKGKPVAKVAGSAADTKMQVNRINVYAMGLLLKDRAPEADVALQKALALDPKNPFTLNNLGFAKEKEGELEQALKFYSDAALTGSDEPVVVTINKNWRGKPIREIASDNANKVRKQMNKEEDLATKVARLNLRGVSAINRNDRRLARNYFEQAYKLDPNNAFTLNNMGYLSEADGDRETAQFFYEKARDAQRTDARVALSTRRDMEGMRMGAVAATNDQTVTDAQQRALEAKRREGGPVVLRKRGDNSIVAEPDKPIAPIRSESSTVQIPTDTEPSNQPTVAPGTGFPGQPASGTNPPANAPVQDVIEPLPDNAQPPNADKGTAPATNPPAQAQPNQQQQQQPQGQPVQDVIPPLPDNQQPPAAQPPQNQQQPPQQQPPQQQPPQKR